MRYKKNDLFNEVEESGNRPVHELKMPDPIEKAKSVMLLADYAGSQLQSIISDVLHVTAQYSLKCRNSQGELVTPKEFEAYASTKRRDKTMLLNFLSIIVGHPDNFKWYLEQNPALVKVLALVLKKSEVKKSACYKAYYGTDMISDTPEGFAWFTENGRPYSNPTLSLSQEVRDFMLQFVSVKYDAEIRETLPDDDNLVLFSSESCVLNELQVLRGLYDQHQMQLNANSKLTASAYKKLLKQCPVEPFCDAVPSTLMARAQLLHPIYAYYRDNYKASAPTLSAEIKDIVSRFDDMNFALKEACVPFVKGFVKTDGAPVVGVALLFRKLFSVLKQLGTRGWVDVDAMIDEFILNEGLNDALEDHFYYNLARNANLYNNNYDEYIYNDNLDEYIYIPALKYLMLTLAAWGVLEVALDRNELDCEYICDAPRFVRVTRLGAYVLGLDPNYKEPKLETSAQFGFELDPENLLIRALGDKNPYEGLLEDFAQPIGSHRYQLSAASVLSHCKTSADIADKINFIRRYVSQEILPDNWTKFFKSLNDRCGAMKRLDSDAYVLLQLPADNLELQRLLSSDAVLRNCSIRAEQFMVLVPKTKLQRFRDRLKEQGYLL